jgi:hypothetical protein
VSSSHQHMRKQVKNNFENKTNKTLTTKIRFSFQVYLEGSNQIFLHSPWYREKGPCLFWHVYDENRKKRKNIDDVLNRTSLFICPPPPFMYSIVLLFVLFEE